MHTDLMRWLVPIIPPIAYYLSTWEVEAEELVLNLSMIPPHAKNTPPKDKQKKNHTNNLRTLLQFGFRFTRSKLGTQLHV